MHVPPATGATPSDRRDRRDRTSIWQVAGQKVCPVDPWTERDRRDRTSIAGDSASLCRWTESLLLALPLLGLLGLLGLLNAHLGHVGEGEGLVEAGCP